MLFSVKINLHCPPHPHPQVTPGVDTTLKGFSKLRVSGLSSTHWHPASTISHWIMTVLSPGGRSQFYLLLCPRDVFLTGIQDVLLPGSPLPPYSSVSFPSSLSPCLPASCPPTSVLGLPCDRPVDLSPSWGFMPTSRRTSPWDSDYGGPSQAAECVRGPSKGHRVPCPPRGFPSCGGGGRGNEVPWDLSPAPLPCEAMRSSQVQQLCQLPSKTLSSHSGFSL